LDWLDWLDRLNRPCHLTTRAGGSRSWGQNLLLLLEENLLLDLLLLGDLGSGGNLGRLTEEGNLRLLKVTTSICNDEVYLLVTL
jgi:hypothetical protein